MRGVDGKRDDSNEARWKSRSTNKVWKLKRALKESMEFLLRARRKPSSYIYVP